MKFVSCILVGISLCFTTYAQSDVAGDSLIVATGRILNAETRELVAARIVYESLPYGSIVGVINGDNYSFPMFEESPYSITVVAPGFAQAKYLLDPASANNDRKVIKDIELTTGAPGGQYATVGSVMRLSNLIFEQGRARISSESFPELDKLAEMMVENRRLVIQLEGHTDYIGNADENMKLSERRVDAVRDYLASKNVHRSQLKTKAFGGTQPLSTDDTPEAHALNRRVEVRILEN